MKYALLDNNQIKVGPRDYHYGFFADYLKSIDAPATELPWNYSESAPVTLAENIFIVPVQDPAIPEHNALTEQLAGPFWNINSTLITGIYNVADVAIDSAKNTLKALVSEKRRIKENVTITITVQGQEVTVSIAREDRNVWQQALSWMAAEDTINFKFIGNVWLTLIRDEVDQINKTVHVAVEDAFNWEMEQIALVDGLTTKAELEAMYATLMEVNTAPVV